MYEMTRLICCKADKSLSFFGAGLIGLMRKVLSAVMRADKNVKNEIKRKGR